MKVFSNLIITIIISCWLIVLPIFAIQNVVGVSIKLFFFESISIPLGILLCFCVVAGLFMGAFIPAFFSANKKPQKNQNKKPKKSTKKDQSPSFVRDWEKEEKDPIFDWE